MRHLALGFMGSAVLFAVACGGKVVVDSGPSGTGGAGGAGGSGGDTVSSASVSPVGVTTGQVTAVSSSTGGASLCEQICATQQMMGCGDAGCVTGCEEAYANAGSCAPQLDAFIICALKSGGLTCEGVPQGCESQAKAYQACIDPGPADCGDISCSVGSNGDCSCQGICNGSFLEVQCSPGDLTNFCTCFKDGMPIGKCSEPQNGGSSCNLQGGCCADQFFP